MSGPDALRLRGQVALVTGASSGIGRALAVGLAARGASVGLLGRDRTRLDAVLDAARATGSRASAHRADSSDAVAITAAVRAVEGDLGPVDLLVNGAGSIERTEVPVWEADPGEWWGVVEASLQGAFLAVRAVVPGMVARGGGRVVGITSAIAVDRRSIYSGYSAAKAAMVRLTTSVAEAGAPHGVRAFDVSPGVVRTPMTAGMALHRDRTEWTDVEDGVALVAAIAAGELDALSGCYLRAGVDTVAGLRGRAAHIAGTGARTVGLRPYGPDDPLA